MKAKRLFIAGFILLAMCSSQAHARANGITEEFHKTYGLSSGGSVRLNNVNGGVQIKVWDKNEVEVDAVKRADDKDMMDQLEILIDTSSDLVNIDTKYPHNSNTHNEEGPWVEYTITVPKDANLDKIRTVNGDIEISGVEGKINASTVNGTVRASDIKNDCRMETVNGKIEAEFASLRSGSDETLRSVNGSIVVSLPANASTRIKANASNGHISNDFGLTSSRGSERDSFVKLGDSLEGKIGSGDGNVNAETVNGGIKILKSGEGE